MSKILVKFSGNYADEFDMRGFGIITQKRWDDLKAKAKRWFESGGTYESYFGTNECFRWECYEEWEACYTVTELTDAEVEVFAKHFGPLRRSVSFPEIYKRGNVTFGEFHEPDFETDDEDEDEEE